MTKRKEIAENLLKTEALEEFKKIAKPIIEKLKEIIDKFQNKKNLKVAIITHDNADPDAISSCVVLQRYLREHNVESDIFTNGGSQSRETKMLINSIGIKTHRFEEFDINKHTTIILIDVASLNQSNHHININKNIKPDLIIDHHSTDAPFESSATIITLLMTVMNFELKKDLATALYIGIDTDTNNGTTEKFTDFDDLAYFKILPPMIDNKLRIKIIESGSSEKEFEMLGNAASKYCLVRQGSTLIVTGVGYVDESNRSDIAKIATLLLKFAKRVTVIGIVEIKIKDKEGNITSREFSIVPSIRSRTITENAGELSKKVFGEKAAGGDPVKASGEIKLGPTMVRLIEQAKQNKDEEALKKYFLEILKLYADKIVEEQTK